MQYWVGDGKNAGEKMRNFIAKAVMEKIGNPEPWPEEIKRKRKRTGLKIFIGRGLKAQFANLQNISNVMWNNMILLRYENLTFVKLI